MDQLTGSGKPLLFSKGREVIAIGLVAFLSLSLNLIGVTSGLPSSERSQYYPSGMSWLKSPQTAERLYETAPYESYHPDEGALLNALSNMKPGAMDFNPHYFNYPSFHIYVTGAMLTIARIMGFVQIVNSKLFYSQHPEEMARIYLFGRLLCAVMGALSVIALYLCGRALFDSSVAFFGALSLAVTALWVRDSHFMLVNIPSAMWMIGSAACAIAAINRPSLKLVVWSAFLAGLAASTKYPAGTILILSLFAWYKMRNRSTGLASLAIMIGCFVLGFLMGTPYALLAPSEFLNGIFFEARSKMGFLSPRVFLSNFLIAHGTVLAVIVAIGVGFVLLTLKNWRSQVLLLWILAGFATVIVSKSDFIRYVIPALPPLALCSGIALDRLHRSFFLPRLRISAISMVGTILLLLPAFAYSVNIDVLLSGNDVRNRAAAWISSMHVEHRDIGIYGNLYFDMPPINGDSHRIVNLESNIAAAPRMVVYSTRTCSRRNWPDSTQRLMPELTQMKVFTQQPLSCWIFPVHWYPEDWEYTFLNVFVRYKEE